MRPSISEARAYGRRRGVPAVILAGALTVASACTVGPAYVRPSARTAPVYKELDGWKTARPQDDVIRGPWWTVFEDPALSALAEQVGIANETVIAAEAQFRQARALVGAARAAYYPTVTAGVSAARSRRSSNTVGNGAVSTGPVSDFSLPLAVSWEADVWGRVRRTVEASEANAQASAADLESIRLSLQAELAQDYFQLHTLDAQRGLLDATIVAFEKSLALTKNRYAGGIASRVDVVQAVTQLETTRAQALDVGVQRAQLEHAIAMLTGTSASSFSLPVAPLATVPPAIPVGVPSELLERRPDVAAAERRVAAANAQIGVAEAAYFPTVTLGATGGLESSELSKWLLWPSRFWSVGPAISETVYDGGLRRAQSEAARAAYDANVASYRQNVLSGFQEVEDNLAALRILDEEARRQDDAVKAAEESVALTTNQYKAGIVSYLNVVIAQTTALADERTAVDILGRRMTASVLLIEALGGGWNAASQREVTTR
jgi:NodT family efflux transporter outer membrane factor (OMF) lipoprotein